MNSRAYAVLHIRKPKFRIEILFPDSLAESELESGSPVCKPSAAHCVEDSSGWVAFWDKDSRPCVLRLTVQLLTLGGEDPCHLPGVMLRICCST